MRITDTMLLNIAQDTVSDRSQVDRSLVSVYLQGSLLDDRFLMGGTADIDLFFIHNNEVIVEREIVRVTDEIHLDIAHHARKMYRQPRMLRVHPWWGPTIYGCRILYDPQHFMDFVQASVRGEFFRPDNMLSRAQVQVEHARQFWMDFQLRQREPEVVDVAAYLRAVEQAANAIAGLSGRPLVERRFLLDFPERAAAIGRPGLYPGLLGLIGAPAVDGDTLKAWLPEWRAAYETLSLDQAPPQLHPHRLFYYLRAFESILEGEQPVNALWPFLRSWTQAVGYFSTETPQRKAWEAALTPLGLLGAAFSERVSALDAYLDLVEETLEFWGREHGA